MPDQPGRSPLSSSTKGSVGSSHESSTASGLDKIFKDGMGVVCRTYRLGMSDIKVCPRATASRLPSGEQVTEQRLVNERSSVMDQEAPEFVERKRREPMETEVATAARTAPSAEQAAVTAFGRLPTGFQVAPQSVDIDN